MGDQAGSFSESQASVLLDLLRALAAAVVVVSHWRNLFFVDYGQVTGARGWLAVPYAVTGEGHAAVVVFFVLSGFFVGGSVLRGVGQGRWSWGDYLLRRGVRLWVVLVPALVLCWGWDRAGMALGWAMALYAGAGGNHMVGNVAAASTLGIFAGNLVFLQTIMVPTFGSDTALWSLACEFWYYVLFPLGFFAVSREAGRVQRVVCCGLVAGGGWLVGAKVLALFPIWLLGVGLLWLPALRVSRGVRWAVGVAFGAMFFWLPKQPWVTGLVGDYGLGVLTLGLLWVMLSARESAGSAVWVRASRGAARFSYSLYALHLPMLVFCAAMLVGIRRWVPDGRHGAAALGVLAGVYGYAYGVAWLTEFRTDAARGLVESWWSGAGAFERSGEGRSRSLAVPRLRANRARRGPRLGEG